MNTSNFSIFIMWKYKRRSTSMYHYRLHHIRTMHNIGPEGGGLRAKFQFSMLKIFQNLILSKKNIRARAKILEKIVFLITENCVFRNTRVIYAIFLNLIGQFSKKIHIFFVHGRSFFFIPQNPSWARACIILFIFIT